MAGLLSGYSTSSSGGYKWEPQDDKVDAEVARITQSGSPLMRQAKADGYAAANKRGLINSSMAVGAAQQSVLNAALPMAQQNAQQTAAKNLSSQEYGQNRGLQEQKFGYDTSLSEQGFRQNTALADQAFGHNTKLSAQDFSQKQVLSDQDFRQNQQSIQLQGTWNSRLQTEKTAQEKELTQLKGNWESRLLGERAGQAAALAAQEAQQQQTLAALNQQSQQFIAKLQADTSSKAQAASMLAEMERAYSSNIQALASNTNIPADEREKYLNQFNALRDSSLKMFEQFYGYDVTWAKAA
jgi:hypothetical protein